MAITKANRTGLQHVLTNSKQFHKKLVKREDRCSILHTSKGQVQKSNIGAYYSKNKFLSTFVSAKL